MNLYEFVREVSFKAGRYDCEAVLGPNVHAIATLEFDGDDDDQGRRLPRFSFPATMPDPIRVRVANALVRAGARHPGLTDADLAAIHRAARRDRHIEIFADINVLTQGLVLQLTRSLGDHVARVVVSSSTIDVLHEYQSLARRHHDGKPATLDAWELARGLRALRELRPPVHVHQLAPGAARYFRRARADAVSPSAPQSEHREETTYIAEDRQMVAAFWDYVATDGPRMPIFLVTSDFALAHVCAAERVPFIFARAPREEANLAAGPVWFDPYAFEYRFLLAQAFLWELVLVLGQVNVRPVGAASEPGFSLTYDPRHHAPGRAESVLRGPVIAANISSSPASPKAPRAATTTERTLKLSLASIVPVLPTHVDQKRSISAFAPKDPDAIRQLWQIGESTGLYRQERDHVIAGPALGTLIKALEAHDYIAVSNIFQKVAGYDRTVREAEQQGSFPSSKNAGAATGWAVTLGAAYKLPGETRFGLADVTDEQFERTVARVHTELGGGERAVPMYRVLDRVCAELKLSPVRFEALLQRNLGQRALREFEAQRATSAGKLPAHQVLTAPTSSASSSYLRRIAPGEGVTIANKLVGSLVRRAGGV